MKLSREEANQIKKFRQGESENPFSIKQNEFYEWLNIQFCDYGTPTKKECGVFPIISYNPKLIRFEMWKIKNLTIKNFDSSVFNTRTKVNSETCLEIDKIKDFNVVCSFISEVCLALIKNRYHFFVWYAQGQKSPHIRIYDFDELTELNPQQRIKAQVLFWKKFVPLGMFHLIDTGVFLDDHELQMEYATHWKYGTPFDLLFEYNPQEEKCNI